MLTVETVTVDVTQWTVLRVAGELDLTEVPFLDSSALGVLVTGLKRLRIAGGTLRLAGCRPPVRALLRITSLDRVFELYPSVGAALHGVPEDQPPTVA